MDPRETINASIGQGYMLSNPVELATMVARIANSELSVEPTLLSGKAKKFTKLDINKNHLNYIKNAMSNVVNSELGTAYKSKLKLKNNYYIFNICSNKPIKIIQVSGQVSEYGIIPLLGLIAAISVNLGVINLLPIPVLDGGHLLFYTYEIIFGKPINSKVQEYGMQIGVSLLIALMIFVTILDISRL